MAARQLVDAIALGDFEAAKAAVGYVVTDDGWTIADGVDLHEIPDGVTRIYLKDLPFIHGTSNITAFDCAVRGGYEDIAVWLLDIGYDVNFDSGYTALQTAARYGSLDLVRLLVDRGVDINKQNAHGATAIGPACANRNSDVLEFLLNQGARVDLVDSRKMTVLHSACLLSYGPNIELLLAYGADPDALDFEGLKPIDLLSPSDAESIAILSGGCCTKAAGH